MQNQSLVIKPAATIMKSFLKCVAFAGLLAGTFAFGLMEQPAEMGLMIVASSVALAFSDIDRFSRIKGAGFEAELRELKTQVAAVIEKETEPLADGDDNPHPSPLEAKLDGAKNQVLTALCSDQFTWRYMGGLVKETGLSKNVVAAALDWLVEGGYARKSHGKGGPIWSATEDGRYLLILH